MELKDLITQLLRNFFVILIFTTIGLVAAIVFNQNQREVFSASLLLYLKPTLVSGLKEANSSADYYGQLRVRDFSDTLIAFLLQPEIQKEIGRKFQLKKLTPQVLRLTLEEGQAEQAKKVVLEVAAKIKERSKKFEEEEKSFFEVEILTPSPSLEKIDPPKILNLITGLLLGFVLGILTISAKIYFSPK
jgi:capsular polysaccharide biosynthesis protein